MTSDNVGAVTEQQHLHDAVISLALLHGSNNTVLMTRFCECLPGSANASSAHCRLANDYNITLMQLCNDQLFLQQHDVVQVHVVPIFINYLGVGKASIDDLCCIAVYSRCDFVIRYCAGATVFHWPWTIPL